MEEALRKEIGFKVRALRKRLGLTQAGLAKKVGKGIDPTYIGKIERGKQFPSIKILKEIGDALSTPIVYFFEEEGQPRVVDRRKAELIRTIETLNHQDISFISEVITALTRHRTQGLLKVAEETPPYSKSKRRGRQRRQK